MLRLIEKLKRRRRRFPARPMPDFRLPALVVVNLVLIALFLMDFPIGTYATQTQYVLRPLGETLTDFGKSGWILHTLVLLFIQALVALRLASGARQRFQAMLVSQLAVYVFICVAASGLAANLLKRAIGRARPALQEQWDVLGFNPFAGDSRFESFPSGHATTVGALMMALALIAPRLRLLFLIMALWLGFTRVILAAHYPSDVIAGLSFGAWFSLIVAIGFARHRLLFRQDEEGYPMLRRRLIWSRSSS